MNFKIRLGKFITTQDMRRYIKEVLDEGWLTEGKYTKLFERKWAKYIGTDYAIAMNSGTSALIACTNAFSLDYEKNDVAVPALTFPATVNSVFHSPYNPELVDINYDRLINTKFIEKDNLAGIIPVHLFGFPVNMDEIMKIKKETKCFILEDCAEAAGSKYKGKRVGSIGDAGIFSFYMSHNIQAGQLGAVTTNDKKFADILRSIKNHGRTGPNTEFIHSYAGFNFKADHFTSAIAYAQVKEADEIMEQRAENAKFLFENIKNPALLPAEYDKNVSYLGYPISCKNTWYKHVVRARLHRAGVETRGMFPHLCKQEFMKTPCNHVIAEDVEHRSFYVPIHQYLTKQELKIIAKCMSV